ncbi:hypothetical protein L6452_02630 [Arctium lappa]|uniref:Uncharacterized protein n=1 Tax=Arctium lappa TaxID=4217 RepID=A0ACB9FK01_ARCLA|nr:hypothetical protein L6452_02630 [Arctium lappa]
MYHHPKHHQEVSCHLPNTQPLFPHALHCARKPTLKHHHPAPLFDFLTGGYQRWEGVGTPTATIADFDFHFKFKFKSVYLLKNGILLPESSTIYETLSTSPALVSYVLPFAFLKPEDKTEHLDCPRLSDQNVIWRGVAFIISDCFVGTVRSWFLTFTTSEQGSSKQNLEPGTTAVKRDRFLCIEWASRRGRNEVLSKGLKRAHIGSGQDYVARKGVVPTVGAGLKSIWDVAVVFFVNGYGDRSHNFSMLSLLLPVVLLFVAAVNLGDIMYNENHVNDDEVVEMHEGCRFSEIHGDKCGHHLKFERQLSSSQALLQQKARNMEESCVLRCAQPSSEMEAKNPVGICIS